jgi:D-cysteine desulfhydrase family pyridoxal phosphate-dependent enzyme
MKITRLGEFPRITLAHRPTPLELMPNLSQTIGSDALFVKRDDCTGLAMGGNKVRQLEFYFGDAKSRGASVVLITGAVQSNYVRATAAAAAKLGLRCVIQLEDRVKGMASDYHRSGNVLLDRLFGAEIHTYPEGEDESGADASLVSLAQELTVQGERPYVVHLSPDHPPLGALGYVEAAEELLNQADDRDIDFRSVVVATGSGQTHAGLLVGLRALGRSEVVVYGVCVRRGANAQQARVLRCAQAVEQLLGLPGVVGSEDVIVTDQHLGEGYGQTTRESQEAILMAARLEGLLLDPVYTGKAFAGMLSLARSGAFSGRPAVFMHTGGTPALFAYGSLE